MNLSSSFFVALALACFVASLEAFRGLPRLQTRQTLALRAANKETSEHTFRKTVSTGALASLIFFSGGLPNLDLQHSQQANFLTPPSAYADTRAAQKRTYFRFVPKLITGRDFYKTDLKQAIEKEDWKVIEKFFEVYVSRYNPNDPNQVDATDTYVNVHFYRPMTVFAGSFAERGTSDKQRALMEQEELFASAMSDLEGCVKDRKGQGFFAADVKMPTGAARKKQAQEAWAKGKAALNEYINIANRGLMLELNKIDTI